MAASVVRAGRSSRVVVMVAVAATAVLGAAVAATAAVSAVDLPTPAVKAWKRTKWGWTMRGCDWPSSGDIVRVNTYQCEAVCRLVLDCTHWTWNGNGKNCYLKRGRRSRTEASTGKGFNVICGAKA